jgi:hypothetical protein
MSQVKWKGYTIEVWVELYDPEYEDDVDYFETEREARQHQKIWPATKDKKIRWAAAEIIDDDGNLNPSVNAPTRKEAIDKLKKVLTA